MSKVNLIAEIGINHNGDLQIAKRLIDAAFSTEWDVVKFQKKTPELCVPEAQKSVMRDTPWGRITYLDYKRKTELGLDDYIKINAYCQLKPIAWTASVWDLPSLTFILENFPHVPFIKIPSAMLTNLKLIGIAAQSGKCIIFSTGMSTLEQIDSAVDAIAAHTNNFVLMHTNSAYPSPPDDLNLSLIPILKQRYNCEVGYSGHEQSLEPTVIAAVLGATFIERHITLSHEMWGTDQPASLEIHAMNMLRKRIKEALLALGDGVKRITAKEAEVLKKLRQ